MSDKPSDVVSDADVERVHGHANFGDMSKRAVLDEGVLKYAFGYTAGHTQMTILVEHGLIRKLAPGSYNSTLTKKGQRYLRSVYGAHFDAICSLAAHPLAARSSDTTNDFASNHHPQGEER